MSWPCFSRFGLLTAALCAGAALVAGCGSSSTSLASGDAAKLRHDVASIRSAAAARNPAAAHTAVRTLEADIAQLKAAGRLAPADASVLLIDAGQLDRRVSVEVHAPATSTPASTTSSVQTTPAGPPAPPGEKHGPHGPGKDKGKGHGDGGGDGGGGGNGGD